MLEDQVLLSSLLPGASLLLPWLHGYSFQGSQLHQLSADEKRDLFERPGVVERTSFGHIFQFQDWLRTKNHGKPWLQMNRFFMFCGMRNAKI